MFIMTKPGGFNLWYVKQGRDVANKTQEICAGQTVMKVWEYVSGLLVMRAVGTTHWAGQGTGCLQTAPPGAW